MRQEEMINDIMGSRLNPADILDLITGFNPGLDGKPECDLVLRAGLALIINGDITPEIYEQWNMLHDSNIEVHDVKPVELYYSLPLPLDSIEEQNIVIDKVTDIRHEDSVHEPILLNVLADDHLNQFLRRLCVVTDNSNNNVLATYTAKNYETSDGTANIGTVVLSKDGVIAYEKLTTISSDMGLLTTVEIVR